MCFWHFFFLLRPLLLDFLSSDESDFLYDGSDDDGSDSGSSGMFTFPLRFDESVGRVSVLGSVIFFNRTQFQM